MASEQNESFKSPDFYSKGKYYWNQVEASIDGMLGGFSNVNVMDADESRGLLKKMLPQISSADEEAYLPRRVLDCGAGIGRVSKYVLSHFFDEIDLLEQNETFLSQSKSYMGDSYTKVKNTFAQGLHEFTPLPKVKYDCIWGQWVFGYITDSDFVRFLDKCASILSKPNGFIVIKDNITKTGLCDTYEEDGSVTRSNEAFLNVFQQVGKLQVKSIFKQKKLPKGLYPVRMYVLTMKIE